MNYIPRIAAALVLALAGSGVQAQTAAGGELRFHGSNTVGAKLAPRLIETYLTNRGASFGQWQTLTEAVEVKGEQKQESYLVLDVSGGDSGVPSRIQVRPYGSSTAFKALEAGQAEIGMSSRPIKAEEILSLAAIGDMTDEANEHIVALDGVAVIVSPGNPISSLTLEQLGQIFACELTDWSQVGGRAGPIQVYARDDNSGTFDTFKSIVLDSAKKKLCKDAKRYEDSAKLVTDVQTDPGGIGFVGMAYVGEAKPLKLVEGALRFAPSVFAVKTEEYPISRRLFFYTPDNKSEFVSGFLRFVQSEAGQRIAEQVKYVDLRVDEGATREAAEHRLAMCRAAASTVQDDKVLGELIADTEGADRLSVTFRFRAGVFEPDNRSITDIDRLVGYAAQDANRERQILLLGFADNVGSYRTNCALAQRRAEAIAETLRAKGVTPALVKGYCEEAPVALDRPKAGSDKNRRVEVWLR